MYRLQWPERLEALANRFFFTLRGALRWQRHGYQEAGALLPVDHPLLNRYQPAYADRFAPATLQDNLQWLELLDAARLKT